MKKTLKYVFVVELISTNQLLRISKIQCGNQFLNSFSVLSTGAYLLLKSKVSFAFGFQTVLESH